MPEPTPDPLLPPDPAVPVVPVVPAVAGVVRPKHVICDFCQCKLAMDGGVLETGARARKFATSEGAHDALEAEVTSLRSQLQTAKDEAAALRATLQPARAASRF